MKNMTISDLQGMALQATQAASQGRNMQALKIIRAYLQARSMVARNGVNTSKLNGVTRSMVRLASELTNMSHYSKVSETCDTIQLAVGYY